MKIKPEEKVQEKPREQKAPGTFSMTITRLVIIQLVILLVAFSAGAVMYRSGIIRPATTFIRYLFIPGAIKDGPVAEVEKNIQDEVRLYQENGLPTLYIDLKFKYYQQLLAKRDEAIKVGVLQTTDDDFVPAKVHLQNGPELASEMRLKGDWTDHLQGDKWSFRIHVKDAGDILHFTQFSIQGPETRNYLNEWAFHRNLMDEGILTTRYSFVNALLNGKLLGIYAIEEHFAPELIESQGRRQGVIIRFDESLFWDNVANFWGEGVHADGGTWMVTNGDSADITPFQASKIAANPTLNAEAETARAMLRAFQTGQRPASEVFDVDLMGRYFALTDLWGACHGVFWHNWRFFYNPVTALLEPVAYDNAPFEWCLKPTSHSQEFIDESGLFNDPQIRAAYARELARITQKGYIEKLQSEMGAEADQLTKALKVEFPTEEVGINWNKLQVRNKALTLELQPAKPARGSYQVSGVNKGDTTPPQLSVDLVNLMILPIDVLRFEVNGTPLTPAGGVATLAPVINPAKDSFNPVHFTLPLSISQPWDDKTAQVFAIVRLTGLTGEFRVPLTGETTPEGLTVGPLPANPTLAETLAKHSFLSASPNGKMLLVSPGIWDVRGDLIIPEGVTLQVSPGTIMRFEPGAMLFARGPLNIAGTANDPVLFTAQQDGWGGIVVIRAKDESTWKYVKVEKTFGITRTGWGLTGGITFFQSEIHIEHALLGNNKTEDAINPIHSKLTLIDSEFENTQADALDTDFCEVEITGGYFHDIGGDAIDISGTTGTISGARMERITDKGVSVGEASTITIRNLKMDIVGIGVASKDLSKAYVYGTSIAHARFSALAAYIKKPVYGPAYLEAPDVVITDTKDPVVVQVGSTVLLHGQPVAGVDLDVDKLYNEGILGN